MKKNLVARCVFLTLSVGVMILIFCFSAQNGTESSGVSQTFSGFLESVLRPFFSEDVVTFLASYIRKFAHVFLYTLLGVFVSLFVFTFPFRHGWLFLLLPVFICFVYACSDELHQLFVEGRDGKFADVLVDAIGFVLAALICNGIRLLVKHFASKRAIPPQ